MKSFKSPLILMFTSKHGTHHFTIPSLFKPIFFYALVALGSGVFFLFVSILVLNHERNLLSQKQDLLSLEIKRSQRINERLNTEILTRMDAMSRVEDRMDRLEDFIGITKEGISKESEQMEFNLLNRIDTSAITSAQKAFIMKFIPNGFPVEGRHRISASFGNRIHPILHISHHHSGIDLATPLNTSVFATADGVVEDSGVGWNGGYGNLVKISHAFGFKTYYAHLNSILVRNGQFVKKGQLIARSGSSGVSTGPHLHYEVRFLNTPINPYNFLQWNMKNFDMIFQKERTLQWQSLLALINALMLQPREDPQLSSLKDLGS